MEQDYTGVPVPPPELVSEWAALLEHCTDAEVFAAAAKWGANQELKACVAWLNESWEGIAAARLHAARRPKPSSLKQQALTLIGHLDDDALATIRRALEQLDD